MLHTYLIDTTHILGVVGTDFGLPIEQFEGASIVVLDPPRQVSLVEASIRRWKSLAVSLFVTVLLLVELAELVNVSLECAGPRLPALQFSVENVDTVSSFWRRAFCSPTYFGCFAYWSFASCKSFSCSSAFFRRSLIVRCCEASTFAALYTACWWLFCRLTTSYIMFWLFIIKSSFS